MGIYHMLDKVKQYCNDNNCSLYDMSLDIGISESSLYSYIHRYKPISNKMRDKIEKFLKERV